MAGPTVTVVSTVEVRPAAFRPVKRNTSAVEADTLGAMKVTVEPSVALRTTVGPDTWVQRVWTTPWLEPDRVTSLPEVVAPTVPASITGSDSSSPKSQADRPNSEATATIPPRIPRRDWRASTMLPNVGLLERFRSISPSL